MDLMLLNKEPRTTSRGLAYFGFLPLVIDLQLLSIFHCPSLHAWEVLLFP